MQRMCALLLSLCFAVLIGCSSTDDSKSTGEIIDDTVITTRVKAALVREPTTKARQIEVETYKGVVQLSGFVDSKEAIAKAVEIAKDVPGVVEVKNSML